MHMHDKSITQNTTTKVTKSGPATVDLDRDLYERLSSLAEARHSTIKHFINEYLLLNIERDELLNDYAPFLSFDNVGKNAIYIHDARPDFHQIPVMVIIRNIEGSSDKRVELECTTDKSKDCIHVQYCLGLPELGKLKTSRPKDLSAGMIVREKRDKLVGFYRLMTNNNKIIDKIPTLELEDVLSKYFDQTQKEFREVIEPKIIKSQDRRQMQQSKKRN
jgi:hypothetical protein